MIKGVNTDETIFSHVIGEFFTGIRKRINGMWRFFLPTATYRAGRRANCI